MCIINKIKKAGLVGMGGASFPTDIKWGMVKKSIVNKKYVVCNAAEGEPGIKKDGYIIENFSEKLINGIEIAINFLNAEKGIIYINSEYYKKYKKNLIKIIGDLPIELFEKPMNAGYIGGEESSVLNAIEGKRIEPRLRPPFPTTNGLWDCPTLINNVETFYNISLVNSGEYKKNRFYTISGNCINNGVYELSDNLTIYKILKQTKNYPKFAFFVQVGGDASGKVLNDKQLKVKVSGAGSITIYNLKKYKSQKILKKWINFFLNESCGQCTPCREGIYRLSEIVNSGNLDWNRIEELLNNLDETSFCGLGSTVSVPIRSYRRNVMNNK